jgi:AraC-like DNA-binding protein
LNGSAILGPVSGYRAVPPAAPLRPFVERLWVNAVPAGRRRILPDGRMDLVWIRGHGVLVAGPQSRFTNRPVEAPLVAFGARFHPGAATSLLRVPAAELLDWHVPLAAVDSRLAARLDALLEGARDDREALAALGRELTRRLADLAQPDPALRAAVGLLRDSSMSVAAVAERVFLSERQLHRRFTESVGYGPKTLQRILRFQRALAELRTPRVQLAGAAAAAGYADQAHLSRESRRLAGLSPGELARWVG